MRKIVVLVIAFFSCFGLKASESRSVLSGQDKVWYVTESSLDTDFEIQAQFISKQFFSHRLEGMERMDEAEFTQNALFVVDLHFDVESNWAQHAVWFNGISETYQIAVNGEIIKTSDDSNFFDLTPLLKDGRAVLVFKLKNQNGIKITIDSQSLHDLIAVSYRDVVVKQIILKDDAFLGGKSIEAHIVNFASKPVDGKLYGRVFAADGETLILENNNCAYSPAGIEIIIDISLPEGDAELISGQYWIEVEMVDKDKGEALIDGLKVQVSL